MTFGQDCGVLDAFREEGWQRRICTRSEHALMAMLFQETMHEWEEGLLRKALRWVDGRL
jgi:hypothetical protein